MGGNVTRHSFLHPLAMFHQTHSMHESWDWNSEVLLSLAPMGESIGREPRALPLNDCININYSYVDMGHGL